MKKILSTATNKHKRHKHMPALTSTVSILTNPDIAPSIFKNLPYREVLILRETCQLWRDLPLNHIVERCLQPKMAFPLVGEFQLFHIFYLHNKKKACALSIAIDISKKEPYFKKAHEQYQYYYDAYTTLIEHPKDITLEQQKKLVALYNGLNTPSREQTYLTLYAVNLLEKSPLKKETLNQYIQTYIKMLHNTNSIDLFEDLQEPPEEHNDQQNPRTIKLLTENPILIFAEKDDYTPLHLASLYCNTTLLQAILNAKADINCTLNTSPCNGQTALHIAAHMAHTTIIEVLLSNGADVTISDTDKNTPLHLAMGNSVTPRFALNNESITALLNSGADYYATNRWGETPQQLHGQHFLEFIDELETTWSEG